MTEQKKCPLCGLPLSDYGKGEDLYQYDCPNCGRFSLTSTAKTMISSRVMESDRFAAVISHAVQRMQAKNSWPEIHSNIVKKIEETDFLPGSSEQADNLILWLGTSTQYPGASSAVVYETARARLGTMHARGVVFIIKSLLKNGHLEGELGHGRANLMLSFEGWDHYDRLKRKSTEGSLAFMAMNYGNDILNKIFADYFKPAVLAAGFDLRKLIDLKKAGLIDEHLRVEIRRSRFIVADLTDDNAGAYWEAGFAEGLGKPVIYTCEKKKFDEKKTHFDTNHLHTVLWESDKPEFAAEELKETVRATLPDEAKMSDD